MKLQKTYKDFVKEVITEKISNKAEAYGTAYKNLRKKKDKNSVDARKILKIYAEAFILNDIRYWRGYLATIRRSLRGHGPVPMTKYHFLQGFFNYYFETVYHGSLREVREYLINASETIQIDPKFYSLICIRKIRKLVSRGERRQLLVSVFDSLT